MIIGLYSFAPSEWNSCKTIVSNLTLAYQKALINSNHVFLDFSRKQSENDLLEMVEKILTLNPSKIIFMDHQPHPANILSLLLPRLNKSIEIFFHVYGDFLLPYPSYWFKLDKYLKKHSVRFICASHAQKKFIQQYLYQSSVNFVCPFPINHDDFYFSESQRKITRNYFNISDENFCWLYTGRMSSQKNIIPLIKAFSFYKEKNKNNDKLILIGPFDNVGIPFLNIFQADHEYFYHYNKVINSLPKKIQQDIHYLGFYNGNEINNFYNMADSFISLSTHNDEDYGMSVAEALGAGLPCLLTRWGGYRSFPQYASKNQSVELIPLFFKKGTFNFSQEFIFSKMKSISQSTFDRSKASTDVFESLGIETISKKLNKIIGLKPEKFHGFNANLLALNLLWRDGQQPFTHDNIHFNFHYKKLYEPYYL